MPDVRPFRCFDSRLLVVTLICLAVMAGLLWVGHGFPKGSPGRIAVAAVQAVAYGWMFVEAFRSVRRTDELEQRIHAEGLAGAAMLSVIVIGCWAFLSQAGLPGVDWGVWAPPLLMVSWAVQVVRITRRYR